VILSPCKLSQSLFENHLETAIASRSFFATRIASRAVLKSNDFEISDRICTSQVTRGPRPYLNACEWMWPSRIPQSVHHQYEYTHAFGKAMLLTFSFFQHHGKKGRSKAKFVLGATGGRPRTDTKKVKPWATRRNSIMLIAENIMLGRSTDAWPQRWLLALVKISSEIWAAVLSKKSPINQPQAEFAECYSRLGECSAELADFGSHFEADLARRRGEFVAAESFRQNG
jgi:hypothetical protein